MRRRDFIAVVGGAAAWPLTVRAQQSGKLPTIGFLGSDALAWSPYTAAFVQRLRELGWIEDRTIAIQYRWSEGRPARNAEIAAEFVRLKVDVIVTNAFAASAVEASDIGHPHRLSIGDRPGRWRPDRKFGAAGRQRHWIDDPAIRSCRQAARTLA